MKKRICLLMLTIWIMVPAMVYGAEADKKKWDIPYLGRLSVPAQLEIIDSQDVITELIKMGETIEKSSGEVNPFSTKTIGEGLNESQISFYQLAVKDNGSYNTAFVVAGRAPDEWNKQGAVLIGRCGIV